MFVALGLIGMGATAGTAGAAGPTGFGAQVTATGWTSTNPPSIPSTNSYDNTVSCVSSSFCVATVFQETSPSVNVLVQIWDGSTWTTQSVPAPAGATDTALLSVSCTSSSFCVAVGAAFTGDSSSDTLPFAIMWNGLSWSMAAGLNAPSGFNDTELAGVSCTGPAWCMAVGFATNTSTSVNETLAEQWDGATWSSSSSASAPGTGAEALLAVSCTGPSNCMAVGPVRRTASHSPCPTGSFGIRVGLGHHATRIRRPGTATSGSVNVHDVPHSPPLDIEVLAEQWNGTSWTVSPAAAPAGATDPEFDGVSCAGIGFCMATGFANLSSSISSFSEEWSNGTWSEVSVPPQGANS